MNGFDELQKGDVVEITWIGECDGKSAHSLWIVEGLAKRSEHDSGFDFYTVSRVKKREDTSNVLDIQRSSLRLVQREW